MTFQTLTTEQRTPEWHAARLGRLTGSCAADMLAKIKTGEAAGRRNLRVRLVLERLTGQSQEDDYVSKDMQRGTDLESAAFAAYEAETGNLARRVGFLAHPDLMAGCSPDAEVGGYQGIVELKCPKSATHLGYLRARVVPDDYLKQVQHNLWITGAQWADFVSWDPRFPPSLRLMITRVTMADAERKAYELLVRMFLAEVDREYEEVEQMAATVGAAA